MTIRKKVMVGLTWTAFSQLLSFSIAFGVSVVLARLLSPNEFGQVAIALGLQAVMNGLADFGFGALIVRAANLTQAQLSSLFWIRVFIAVLQMLVMYVAAPCIAIWFDNPELTLITRWLSTVFILSAFSTVPEALLRRDLDFRAITYVTVISMVVSGVIGILLAYKGFGVWSLISQTFVGSITAPFLLFTFCQWRPSFVFRPIHLKEHFSFISNIYGLNIVGSLVNQSDRLVLGKLLGPELVGIYMRGAGLAQQVQGMAISVAEQVGFPALSLIKDDQERTGNAFLQIVMVIGNIVAPVLFLIAVQSDEIIEFVYGEKWIAAGPILKVISFVLFVHAINIPWDWLLRAVGKADILFRWSLFDGSARILGIGFGAYFYGITGAAISLLLVSAASLLLRTWWMGREVGINYGKYMKIVLRPVLYGGSIYIIAWASKLPLKDSSVFQQLSIPSMVALLGYLMISLVFKNPLLSRFAFFR